VQAIPGLVRVKTAADLSISRPPPCLNPPSRNPYVNKSNIELDIILTQKAEYWSKAWAQIQAQQCITSHLSGTPSEGPSFAAQLPTNTHIQRMPGKHVKRPKDKILVEHLSYPCGSLYTLERPWITRNDSVVSSDILRLVGRTPLRCS
jgi:hypothetical protein